MQGVRVIVNDKEQLKAYEEQWRLHHKHSHKSKELQDKYPMPPMIEWSKLKYKLKGDK